MSALGLRGRLGFGPTLPQAANALYTKFPIDQRRAGAPFPLREPFAGGLFAYSSPQWFVTGSLRDLLRTVSMTCSNRSPSSGFRRKLTAPRFEQASRVLGSSS